MKYRIRRLDLSFSFPSGTIIDVETNFENQMICCGFLFNNRLQSYILEDNDIQGFREFILSYVSGSRRPFYAFYKKFEEDVLDCPFDVEIQRFQFEKKKFAVRVTGIKDPYDGDGYKVMGAYKEFLKDRDVFWLEEIMDHNVSCLLQEACLILCRGHRV